MRLAAFLLLTILSGCGLSVQGASTHYGGFEIPLESRERSIYPVVGHAVVRGDNHYTYAGLQFGEDFWESWEYAVTFGAGYYEAESLDLGGSLEFRTAVEILPTPHVGFGAVHMSNAGLGEFNPGFDAFFIVVRF